MRKKHLKKIRSRDAFDVLKNTPNQIKIIYDSRGNGIALNTTKHAIYMNEYRNEEYNEEMARDFINKVKNLNDKKTETTEPIILKQGE